MAATTITVPTATTSPAAGAAATAGSGFNGESPVTTLVRTTRIEENRLVWLVYMMGETLFASLLPEDVRVRFSAYEGS